jgi:4'-phosphopantetheinyl transferase EntD
MNLAALVPASVAVEQLPVDAAAEAAPLAEEEAALGVVAPSRRREYTAGRICARRALERLGMPSTPILRGPGKEPVWPAGIVGAITHTTHLAAAAVARRADVATVGIDIEVAGALDASLRNIVLLPEEEEWLRYEKHADVMATVLFSAKESVYKAFFPLERRWLGFEDVVLAPPRARGLLYARFRTGGISVGAVTRTELEVRYATNDDFVATAVAITAA